MLPAKVMIITGLSGSGKSSALHLLEDLGFFTIDNLPVGILPDLLKLLSDHPRAVNKGVGAVIDVRSGELKDNLENTLTTLRRMGVEVTILYLEASDDILLRRFSLTRRRHPLGFVHSLLEGIMLERSQLAFIRSCADFIIDTSNMSMNRLREEISSIFTGSEPELQVTVSSFGFKYGIARDADYVLDVRFLANPYYDPALRPKCGKDPDVAAYILDDPSTEKFLHKVFSLFEDIIPVYRKSGKNYFQISVGCTGGRHRSVFCAEWLGKTISAMDGVNCRITHRDIDRDGKTVSNK